MRGPRIAAAQQDGGVARDARASEIHFRVRGATFTEGYLGVGGSLDCAQEERDNEGMCSLTQNREHTIYR